MSENKPYKKNTDVVTVHFHKDTIEDIVELMRFSKMAANLLITQELQKGTVEGATKMKAYAELSADLMASLISHLNIGEPPDNSIN